MIQSIVDDHLALKIDLQATRMMINLSKKSLNRNMRYM